MIPRPRSVGAVVVAAVVAAGGWAIVATDDHGGPDVPAASTSTTTPTASSLPSFGSPGSRGVGDPYFPDLGNGGFDVAHYDLDLTWQADAGTLAGVASIAATATQDLSRFDLDLSGLTVRSVAVDGAVATFAQDGGELVVTPPEGIHDGATFTTRVVYDGRPTPLHEGTDLFQVGWQTDGREAFVASEPAGGSTFFPGSDHPSDKATYAFRITAPSDQVVATNGLATGNLAHADGTTTWTSDARDPIASYLVQIAIGDYEVVDGGRSAAGVPIRHVLHRDLLPRARATVADTPRMLDVLSDVWGPYAFEVYGVLAVDEDLGFALETQTLTLIGSDTALDGARRAESLLVHELAHQWTGDAVSPASWKDIWLNEGFATYSEWMWSERTGGDSAATLAREHLDARLRGKTGDPGPDELFQSIVYARGGLTLQAVREAVGDDAFFRVLRAWVGEHSGRSASSADFEALCERESGKDLSALFQRWLYADELPGDLAG